MAIILVTGIQGAGKSTIAQALAERIDRSVHVRGDLFRRMVVNGRVEMGAAGPSAEAVRQLKLRYHLAAATADGFVDAGFTAVLQDIVIGSYLTEVVASVRTRPLYVVVLCPSAEVVQHREDDRHAARGKTAYKPGDRSVVELDALFRAQTPKIGLWLDTSDQTVEETVDEVLVRVWTEAAV